MRVNEAAQIIKQPYVTEKTFTMMEKENKLVFLVNEKYNKRAIKQALEILYDIKVESVNTVNTIYGKKAYVKLSEENAAANLAAKLGIV